jgi:hypothetical protein
MYVSDRKLKVRGFGRYAPVQLYVPASGPSTFETAAILKMKRDLVWPSDQADKRTSTLDGKF